MTSAALSFSIQTDLYHAGHTDDGAPFEAECYFVMAEDAKGNRWTHSAIFRGCIAEHYNDEGGCGTAFHDKRAEAMAQAERLLARIEAAGGRIDFTHWHEARPCYGSAAYQAYGQFNDWMEERLEAEQPAALAFRPMPARR